MPGTPYPARPAAGIGSDQHRGGVDSVRAHLDELIGSVAASIEATRRPRVLLLHMENMLNPGTVMVIPHERAAEVSAFGINVTAPADTDLVLISDADYRSFIAQATRRTMELVIEQRDGAQFRYASVVGAVRRELHPYRDDEDIAPEEIQIEAAIIRAAAWIEAHPCQCPPGAPDGLEQPCTRCGVLGRVADVQQER